MKNCKNILITGGAGFIGAHFLNQMVPKNSDTNFINIDILSYASDLNRLKKIDSLPNYKFYQVDICDKEKVIEIFQKYSIDGLINFAAESHVDNSILNPNSFIKTNVNGTLNLLNICYDFWMKSPFNYKPKFKNARFHQISTDEVYGSIEKGSFDEYSRYNPSSPYSSSKASADFIVSSFNKTYGLNTTISLSSNNFGLNQNSEKFIPVIISSIINNCPIPVYGDGKNIRDWISVKENCNAINLIFNNGVSGESYNIGGGNELANLDLINLTYRLIKKYSKEKIDDLKIDFINDRFGHDKRYSINSSKLYQKLNWDYNNSIFQKNFEQFIYNSVN